MLKYYFNKFNNISSIRKLYENTRVSKKIIDNNLEINKEFNNSKIITKKINKLPENFKNNILNSSNFIKTKLLYNNLRARLKYLNTSLINNINEVVAKSELLNAGIIIENSCCIENLSEYKRYDNYRNNF